ncbi:hypothetical protein CW696_04640 [ANME-2 cluster archaeon]|nr:MAG: hypothetical protein CW696_04640 [ANME-2 cluster archaeon]
MELEFPYAEEESGVLNTVKRPRIKMDAFSELASDWITIDEVLADTGADFCVLPRYDPGGFGTILPDRPPNHLTTTFCNLTPRYCRML